MDLSPTRFKANNGSCDLDLDQATHRRRDTEAKAAERRALLRSRFRVTHLLRDTLEAFSTLSPAGRPHEYVLEKDALIAGRKQSVALRARNLAVIPTTWGIDRDDLVLRPAAWTAKWHGVRAVHG